MAVLRSSNYAQGNAGWLIRGDGLAEFNDLTVRTKLDIGGDDNTSFHVDANGNMWVGSGISNFSTAPFRVTNTGALTATNVNITGAVTATSGSFTGSVTSTSGRIGPFTLSSDGLTNVTDTGYAESNFMRIQNYGDMSVFSNPSSGPHSGAFHRTDIYGENITISRHADKANMLAGTYVYPYLALGSFTNGEMELTIVGGAGSYPFKAHSNGSVTATGTITAAAFNGNASSATYATTAGSAGALSGTVVKFVGAGSSGAASFWIHDQGNGSSTLQDEYTAVLGASWLAGPNPQTTWGITRDGYKGYIQQYYTGNSYSSRTITGASDRRVKDNIEPISGVIDVLGVIDTIEPKIYDYLHYATKKLDENGNTTEEDNEVPKKFGFIAQELQDALGEYGDLVVDEIDDPRYDFKLLTTEDRGLIAIMWEAIRQLKTKIDELESRLV
jgi:hypothetical protein